jgi:hypothetical protein
MLPYFSNALMFSHPIKVHFVTLAFSSDDLILLTIQAIYSYLFDTDDTHYWHSPEKGLSPAGQPGLTIGG